MAGYKHPGDPKPAPKPQPAPKPRGHRPRSSTAPCGTLAAYARHKRRGETVDPLCRQANIDYCTSRRKASA